MAERRMFTKKITESDAFLDMPMSAQCLYFHLNMSADDDGFTNNPKKIMRAIGASEDDFKLLILKSFVLTFDTGVIVIKHWKMHNYIKSDRYKPTDYVEEKAMLGYKQDKSYTLDENKMVSKLSPNCIQTVSIGKDRLGKDRLGKNIYIGADDQLDKNGAYTLDSHMSVICQSSVGQMSAQDRIGKDSIGEYSYIVADDQPDKTLDQIKEIIDYLNTKLGSKYSYKTASTKKHINARLAEGHTIEEFKLVIDKKYDEWHKDERMSKFLRPETLFGTKFEGYLNQPTVKGSGSKKNGFADFEGKQEYDFDEIEKMILSK